MADESDVESESAVSVAEEPLQGPDGALDCIDGRYDFIAFWLKKLGIEDPSGSAIIFGESCSVAILNPQTGEWMTPKEIVAKRVRAIK